MPCRLTDNEPILGRQLDNRWKYHFERTIQNLRLFTSQGSQVMENNDSFMGNNSGIVAHCSPLKSVHSAHGLVLQSSESSLFPWQPFPPLAGLLVHSRIINDVHDKTLLFVCYVGLLHFRVRKRTPTPQVLEHVFHSDQVLQLPSLGFLTTGPTTFFRFPIASQNPFMHHCVVAA